MASLSSKRKTTVNRRLKQRDVRAKVVPIAAAPSKAFDEVLYSQVKPRFASALARSCDGDADVRKVMRVLVQQEFDDGGRDGALQMQPYIVKYVGDYRAQRNRAESSAA